MDEIDSFSSVWNHQFNDIWYCNMKTELKKYEDWQLLSMKDFLFMQ